MPPTMAEVLGPALDSIHPNLAAAIGHAMDFAVVDSENSLDPVLADPELLAAARSFHATALALAEGHPNIQPEEQP